jgi:phosphoribosylaminoimidazole carboxylase/phosphoribosylaminoimidazole-succinocarboxamide synthase
MNISSEVSREVIAEGKTKIIYRHPDDRGLVIVKSKDDITAGDGAKHDVIEGKAAWATTTTVNVFELLEDCGVNTAFYERMSDTEFVEHECDMLPFEVVVRRELHGSALKREPWLEKGHLLPKLRVEFFLKTNGKKWQGVDIPVDDPYMVFNGDEVELYLPDQPIYEQTPFMTIVEPLSEIEREGIEQKARYVFLILEKQWSLLGRKLVDFKLEFGSNRDNLLLADVVDADSWRLIKNDQYQDKQVYRDGGELSEVAEKYRQTAELTERFGVPEQQLIIWKASEKDDEDVFFDNEYDFNEVLLAVETGSLHKEPVESYTEINQLIQEVPDAVVIVYCGRSNGAGPTLSAQVTVPVITVPAGWKDFPDDVWSSLRTPSEVPVSTILEPSNAILHALQILAMRNPQLYASLRYDQENRLYNL